MTDRILSDTAVSAPSAITFLVRGLRCCRNCFLLALLVLAAGLTVTFQLSRSSAQQALHELQSSFDFSVREASTRIEQRMAAYEQVLHSAEGFMSHADFMTRDEFRHFVGKLHLNEKYPGIQGVAFVQIVPAAHKERHLAAIRSEGFPAYAIHPGGERALYAPVIYIEPFSGMNLRAFGHDPYSDAVRRAAMEQARDLDLAVITSKLTLVQETGKNAQAGFMMYLPVFKYGAPHRSVAERRAAIMGWVSAPFRMNDLMDGLHGEQAANLDLELFDGEQISAATLMYDPDHDYVDGEPPASLFKTIQRIRIANHTWTLQIRSLPGFDARLDRNSPRIIATSGIGISLLLSLLTLLLLNGRARARQASRAMNRELIERETRYRQMFENNASIAFLMEPDSGRIVDANAAAAAFWGYPLAQLRNMNIAEISAASNEQNMHAIQQILEGKRTHFEWRQRLKNGEIREVDVFSGPLAYQGKVLVYSIMHDISARKQAQQALAEESTMNALLLRTASDGIHVLDPQGNLVLSNDAFCRMHGYTQEELQGMHVTQWNAQFSDEQIQENFHLLLDKDALFETRHRRRDGSIVDVEIHTCGVVIGGKRFVYAAARDITERKRAAQRVHHLAHFDTLTDLPNRELLNDRLQQALAKARRDHTRIALMFLDLDKFKPVNDSLGHDVGDLLLKEVALRMQGCVRESDTVARVGGDEFVVLLPSIENEQDALMVAQKILSLLEQPFPLAGRQIDISASIGIAIYPEHGEDENALVKSADQAMYLAKQAGGSALIFYRDLAHMTPSADP